MIKYLSRPIISEKDKEDIDLAMWAWNSHYWIENSAGYFQCRYCDRNFASDMSISLRTPDLICTKNPILKR